MVAFWMVSCKEYQIMTEDSPCSVALPHGAVGWSAVCVCGIS